MKALVAAGSLRAWVIFPPGDRQPQIHELAFVHAHRLDSQAPEVPSRLPCSAQATFPRWNSRRRRQSRVRASGTHICRHGRRLLTPQNASTANDGSLARAKVARAICSPAAVARFGWSSVEGGTGCGRAGKGGARRRAGH